MENPENMWFTDNAFVDFENKRVIIVDHNNKRVEIIKNSNVLALFSYLAKNKTKEHFEKATLVRELWNNVADPTAPTAEEKGANGWGKVLEYARDILGDQQPYKFLAYERGRKWYVFCPPPDKPPPEGFEAVEEIHVSNWKIILKKKSIFAVCALLITILCVVGIMKAMHSTTDDGNTLNGDKEINSEEETAPGDSESVINDTMYSETNPVPGYEGIPESYNMECFVGRTANGFVKQFYDHDISDQLDELGLSKAYGVWHHEYTFPASEVDNAARIYKGQQQGGSQNGTNACDATGYSLQYGDAFYIFFIKSINYSTGETTSPQTKPTQIETRSTTTDNTIPVTETAGGNENKADTPVSVVVVTVPVDNGSREMPTNPSNDTFHYEPPITQEQTAVPQQPATQEQTVVPQSTADFPDIEISSVDARIGESDVCISVIFKNLTYRGRYSSIDMNFNAVYNNSLIFKSCTASRDDSEITDVTYGDGQISFNMHGNYCENDVTVNLFFDIPNDASEGDYEIRIFEEATVITLSYSNNWYTPWRVLQSLDRTGKIHVS